MLYYLGKGTEFVKENCKEYKTAEGALKAAAKNEGFSVWDETGKIINDNAKIARQQDSAEAPTDGKNGDSGENVPVASENGQNEANSASESEQQTSGNDMDAAGQQVSDSDTPENGVVYLEKATRAVVDCDGALNLRRSPAWCNENICGRAVRGQSYYVKAIHTVEGKKMLETIDGIFLSAQPEHVHLE